MKKLLVLLLAVWVGCAQADGLTVTPVAGKFSYAFASKEEFVMLSWRTDAESAQCTLYSDTGSFSGEAVLLHTFAGSPLRVAVHTLDGAQLFSQNAETVPVERETPVQALPDESPGGRLTDIEITPLICAVQYHFRAAGYASLLLQYRSSTERGAVTVYAGDNYMYDGILSLPYTYNNANVVLTVGNPKGTRDLYEVMLRTDYPVTEARAPGDGRLRGITVCIDPGHQEIARYTTEERGPGLSGTSRTGVGMAQGVVTRRMESIVVLEIGFMLRDALLSEGAQVVMTRQTQDTYLTNRQRAEIAAAAGADFFLRLHCDTRDTKSSQGIGIFCPRSSAYAKAIADEEEWLAMGDILLHAMQKTTRQSKGNTTASNQYIGNNWATMPSFLIEMGYMSNPVEDVLLSARAYQQKLAAGMVQGVYELALYRGLLTAP